MAVVIHGGADLFHNWHDRVSVVGDLGGRQRNAPVGLSVSTAWAWWRNVEVLSSLNREVFLSYVRSEVVLSWPKKRTEDSSFHNNRFSREISAPGTQTGWCVLPWLIRRALMEKSMCMKVTFDN